MIDGDLKDSTKKENLEAMDRLFEEKESDNKQDMKRYRYYTDLYGNRYSWTTHKQEDGKFKGTIKKANHKRKGWLSFNVVKEKSFVKRKSAKSWCLKNMLKAREHQKIVLNARTKRKQDKIDAKPKLNKVQKLIQVQQKKIDHYKKLQSKADTKIKALTTRKKTYEKKINYHTKRIVKLNQKEIKNQ